MALATFLISVSHGRVRQVGFACFIPVLSGHNNKTEDDTQHTQQPRCR